ncbi:pseudouridine synthase [Zychaea mexicana]|uniref:pseudouridine synthase n=1 Tax=Zychaea mexicana TaxID=64656 RepID=UPI0022FDCAED|nr:pseudouridine synthase [Zychaea mexicana]KAI9493376.1 pseudouridine synthase [Zychaea mexicana]
MEKYESWTREQLLERIATLESSTATAIANNTTKEDAKLDNKSSKRKERPFDMSKYNQRHIALKVAYLGWNYMGFAAQTDEETIPTVEGRLFQALQRCKLITTVEECNFSRCGRTDKGVSGLGQVVSLKVRSNGPDKPEITYVDTLNRLLPDDIRVLAWAPVDAKFNARFDCKSRTYKYFFTKGDLDLEAMQKGARYFLGQHDFRNFCKLDPSKNITNYERRVVSLDINRVTPAVPGLSNTEFFQVELKGTAFLWHQVRCIMSVLFLVGQKLEEPEIVQALLNVSEIEARPDYPMASELPLLLYDCEFENIHWVTGNGASTARIYQHWRELWSANMTRTLLCQTFMQYMQPFPVAAEGGLGEGDIPLTQYLQTKKRQPTVVLGGGREQTSARYKKLLDRQRCDSDEVKKQKYRAKKQKTTSAN